MLRHILRPTSLSLPPKFQFSSFASLTSFLKAPVKHFKRMIQPTGVNYSPVTNTTQEAFDEVSQEWQALIVGNPYDVNTYNYLEQVSHANFGTVDNPHVVFTSDAPFRYVGCTGAVNEDDYESHELQMFMLREGSLQRCPSCGQVFKLVRLRNEFSPEMDYYASNFLPYDMHEMAEMDHTIMMNPLKINTHHEHSVFETPSNYIYTLVNPDDHDRLLTDPAYRLEKVKQLEEINKVYIASLQEIDQQYKLNYGITENYHMNKIDYITMLEVEKTILKIDRLLNKVDKFNARRFIDPANHERREARMEERGKTRWDNNYTFYYGSLTEEEQKYKDYFETDVEKFPEDEKLEERHDEEELLGEEGYKLSRYDFQEMYTYNPEEDQTTYFEKKIFKFRYRRAADSEELYRVRNERMINRHLQRFGNSVNIKKLAEVRERTKSVEKTLSGKALVEYASIMKQEAIQQYKDYFEDDKNEDFTFLEKISPEQEINLLNFFENHVTFPGEVRGFFTLPKRRWNKAFGLWTNFYLDLKESLFELRPQAEKMLDSLDYAEKLGYQQEELARIEESKKIEKK